MLLDPRSDELLLKRVVGVAGDEVALEDGGLVVNGAPVDEPFVDRAELAGRFFGPVVVPPGSVFVMGDDRADSVDSRTFGAVATADVVGPVVARF